MQLPEIIAHCKPAAMVQLTQKIPGTPEARNRTRWKQDQGDLIEIFGDTAVFNLSGDVFRAPNYYTYYGYGFSTDEVAEALQSLPPSVSKIHLCVNSSGGDVWGTHTLSEHFFGARENYEITAIISSVCASAAYWIASAAHQIYISEPTVYVGSIGVYSVYYDYSQAYENEGIKIKEITAGRYKAVGSPVSPLTEEGEAVLQERVDTLYGIFLEGVAKNRGGTAQTVHSQMGDGRIFIGQQAIDAGLVDGFLSQISGGENVSVTRIKEPEHKPQAQDPNPEPQATNPTEAVNAAIKKERERVASIRALSVPGYDAQINAGIDDGLSAGAVAISILAAMKKDGPPSSAVALATQIIQKTSAEAAESCPERPVSELDPFTKKLTKAEFEASEISAKFKGHYGAYCKMFEAKQRQTKGR